MYGLGKLFLLLCLLVASVARMPHAPRAPFRPIEPSNSTTAIPSAAIPTKLAAVAQLRGGSLFSQLTDQLVQVLKSFLPTSWFKKSRYGKSKRKSQANKYVSGETSNRIQKEVQSFLESPPDNCVLKVGANIRSWVVTLTGVNGTVFEGETYKLKMIFPKDYPSKPPSVYFLKPCPKHMHVYTNGDICLNFLGRDWRPTLTAQMLTVSILSMLSSAKEKSIPQDNALHADAQPGQQQDNWMYHDDRC
ncbi:ubiquitin-conjugating enzyme/RWD-like protein [Ochromonadaceae sp. CCMP2298]|nr:ubiquitin-conjugating enzyme/RWD-like protein [Ochromonadaceae sp. CCMP2298]|mmetsp:Transcript_9879/g.22004  ORF Transcript_9879/g.22004 Transcript_9879/m.22004 type:complete len:247 (-) Transcript_9879:84-824(-)